MFATKQTAIPTIAILQVAFGAWAIFHVLRQLFLGESPAVTLNLGVSLLFLVTAIAAGVLLLMRTRVGIWLSIGVQGVQMYLFAVWKVSFAIVLGPHCLIYLWPEIGFWLGYRFYFFATITPEPSPLTLTINLVPASLIVILLTAAKEEDAAKSGVTA